MNQCFSKYFIYNEEIKKREEFDENVLKGGKTLYEVIRIIDGRPLFLKRHLNRLENSSKITKLNLWLTRDKIKEKIIKLVKVNNIHIGNIKLLFNFESNSLSGNDKKDFICYFIKHEYPSKEDYINGVYTILYHKERTNPNAKVINNDFRRLADKEIKEKNAYEAILVDRNGYITEGSRSNIFMVKDKDIITAPVENVLPGTTRDVIIEICKNMKLSLLEKEMDYRKLEEIDALFISGTSPEVLPIKSIDNMKFNSSKNEIVLKIMKEYANMVKKDISMEH